MTGKYESRPDTLAVGTTTPKASIARRIGLGGLLLLAMVGLTGCVVYPAGGYYAPGYVYAPGVYVGGGYGYYRYHGGWRR